MKYCKFGKTGWRVSQISLGTVELGIDYGIRHRDRPNQPSKQEALKLLLTAFEQGINFLDTAPAYGTSEAIIGSALKKWSERIYVATKINRPDHQQTVSAVKKQILTSVHDSLKSLGRDCLDIVQIHNAIANDFRDDIIFEALLSAQKAGKIRFIGASVYDVEAALEAVGHPEISCVQVAYNLLDQRMAANVFPAAVEKQVGLIARSALLKGVLTDRYHSLPPGLQALGEAAQRAECWANSIHLPLAPAAIHFCLSDASVSSVLVGVSSVEELDTAISVSLLPRLKPENIAPTADLALADGRLVDPRTWGIP